MSKETRARGSNRSQMGGLAGNVVFMLIFTVILIGLVLYLVAIYQTPQGFRPFDLATVAGLLGGLMLVCAYANSCPERLKLGLRKTGVSYLVSTMAFVIFGLYQAADQAGLGDKLTGASHGWFVGVYMTTFYLGAIALSVALFWTIWSIPALVRWDGRKEVISDAGGDRGESEGTSEVLRDNGPGCGKHQVEYNGFRHQALPEREPPYFLGDNVGFKVEITNLSDQRKDGRFVYFIQMPEGTRLERPVHIGTDPPLDFAPRETKIVALGDPVFCAFLGIFQLVLVVGDAERELVSQGKTSQPIRFETLFAGYSQDRESYRLQKRLVTLTSWIRGLTIALVCLTVLLVYVNFFHQ